MAAIFEYRLSDTMSALFFLSLALLLDSSVKLQTKMAA